MAAIAINYFALHLSAHLFKHTAYGGVRAWVWACACTATTVWLFPKVPPLFRDLLCFVLLLTVLCNVGSRDQHSLEMEIHSLGSALIVAYKSYRSLKNWPSLWEPVSLSSSWLRTVLTCSLPLCHLSSKLLVVTKSLMDGCSSLSTGPVSLLCPHIR